MSTNESLKTIAARLYKENICVTPLDERSLETVSGYMNYYLSNNDLCRRLSDVELNYVQISSEAESASNSVAEDKESVVTMLRKLTDLWRSKGYFLEYFFSSSETDGNNLRQTYLSSLEFLRVRLNSLSRELLIISETAACPQSRHHL